MKLSLGISPCPNDTFMFDAWINNKVSSEFELEIEYEDVAQLNRWAHVEKLDVTKISFHAWAKVCNTYQMLNAGAALGFGVGPLLISKENISIQELDTLTIGIPGEGTTANFLLDYYLPNIKNKEVMLFSEIEAALLDGKIDAGVIIHENRFTYQDKGLKLIQDLGTYWEEKTKLPIPLGGIAVKRSLPRAIKLSIQAKIRESIEYAFENPTDSEGFVRQFAQEMDIEVIKKHIDLYVNQYSLALKKEGKASIDHFLQTLLKKNQINFIPDHYILSS